MDRNVKRILNVIIITGLLGINPAISQTVYRTQGNNSFYKFRDNDVINNTNAQNGMHNKASEQVYYNDGISANSTNKLQKNISKKMKQNYKEITQNDKLIEACEILKDGAGNFAYSSIHGNNKTYKPIEIIFINFPLDEKYKNLDAYSQFEGNRYKIRLNAKYMDAPAEAIAPIIAREALVGKNKSESDIQEAQQLQIAVWTQILEKNPWLAKSDNKLVIIQNKLKAGANPEEYNAFLNEASIPVSKNQTPPKEILRSFGSDNSNGEDDADDSSVKDADESEEITFNTGALHKKYKKITKEERIMEALELLKDTVGKYSHDAILGDNLTHKPISIKFKNLSEIKREYSTFDALGCRQAGKLNIYINSKHSDAPAAAIAAILAHEALHQDEFDSLNEETYAWTMEASVWTQLCDKTPSVGDILHPLVKRENLLKKLLEKGDYTNKYIKKIVFSNSSYSNLPVRSPGFEDDI